MKKNSFATNNNQSASNQSATTIKLIEKNEVKEGFYFKAGMLRDETGRIYAYPTCNFDTGDPEIACFDKVEGEDRWIKSFIPMKDDVRRIWETIYTPTKIYGVCNLLKNAKHKRKILRMLEAGGFYVDFGGKGELGTKEITPEQLTFIFNLLQGVKDRDMVYDGYTPYYTRVAANQEMSHNGGDYNEWTSVYSFCRGKLLLGVDWSSCEMIDPKGCDIISQDDLKELEKRDKEVNEEYDE